jgi:hypothetical protein
VNPPSAANGGSYPQTLDEVPSATLWAAGRNPTYAATGDTFCLSLDYRGCSRAFRSDQGGLQPAPSTC